MRVVPPPSRWEFPPATTADDIGVVGVGADLEPGTLLAAYRGGLFPMPAHQRGRMAWWSPDPRGILPLDGMRITRSLRQSIKRYEIRVDTACAEVIDLCADPSRDGAWIDGEIRKAYVRLHEMGWVHSVEAWRPATEGQPASLAGGLYGVSIGGFFAGESMFHRERDASKVALAGLVDILRTGGAALLDVQWTTDHLASLGAVDVPRHEYLAMVRDAVDLDVDPFDPLVVDRVQPGPALAPTSATNTSAPPSSSSRLARNVR